MKKLIPIPQVCELTGLKKSAIYQRISDGRFMKPVKIGRSSRWDSESVSAWVEKAIAEGRAK
jgi:prophage regulatory protein